MALALFAAAFVVVTLLRPGLAERFRSVKQQEDKLLLPPPEMTVLMSLGYRSALADLIFAHVLVGYGQHFQQKRRFELVDEYLDTIITLDPKFREPLSTADTLISVQPGGGTVDDLRAARRIQERGLTAFPHDSELWLVAGQFHAYLAANLVPPAERDEWRMQGAKYLARSCELMGSNENIPHHCITAAVLFNKAGQRDAMRSFLERVLTVSDDPEIQELAGTYLGSVLGQAERDRFEERGKRFRTLWARDMTFVTREMFLLLGPPFDPARCAGRTVSANTAECWSSFRAWGEAQ